LVVGIYHGKKRGRGRLEQGAKEGTNVVKKNGTQKAKAEVVMNQKCNKLSNVNSYPVLLSGRMK